MAETTLENFTTLEKSNDDTAQQSRSEFANIYTQLPPCVRKDINARITRKKLDCGSDEALKIITHCRDQYFKKRDYNRQLGATVRNLAKTAKLPTPEPVEAEAEAEAEEPADESEAEPQAEELAESDKLDAILSEPKKEMPNTLSVPPQGVPRTAVRQINTGVSKLFKSPDKLRRS
jgi:hypothetical protein